jgi:RNA polymerase II elongation factor ELL
MADFVLGVEYVLSWHGHFHENKLLIFLRLTDSAYRAIEDFLRKKLRHIMI